MARWAWSRSGRRGPRPRPYGRLPAPPWAGSTARWPACDPVALVAGGREHLPERHPQPQRAVADRHHRRLHAAPSEVAEDLGPTVGGLALTVRHGDQLLGAVGAHAHDDQTAQAGLLEPHPEVDAVGPDVHIVPVGQVTLAERLVVACQLASSRPTAAADSPAAEPKNAPAPGRSRRWTARAGTAAAGPRRPWGCGGTWAAGSPSGTGPARQSSGRSGDRPSARTHRDRPGRSRHLALAGVAVADHQPPATLVTLGVVGGQVGVDLSLQRGSQQAASPSSPALPRRSPTWVGQAGGYVALTSPDPIHNSRSYLELLLPESKCGPMNLPNQRLLSVLRISLQLITRSAALGVVPEVVVVGVDGCVASAAGWAPVGLPSLLGTLRSTSSAFWSTNLVTKCCAMPSTMA
jgi:hypothetical protein